MPTILDATVVNQAYDTSGNGGRKLVRLSNGWLVALTFKADSGYTYGQHFLYVSKDNGVTWEQLCWIANNNHRQGSGGAIVARGTDVYVLVRIITTPKAVAWVRIDCLTQTNTQVDHFTQWIEQQNDVQEVSLAINEAGTELHAAWASKNSTYPNSFNIRYAKGTINADGSVTWGAVEQWTTTNANGLDFKNPTIQMHGNIPMVFAETPGLNVTQTGASVSSSYQGIIVLKRDNTLTPHTSGLLNGSIISFKYVYSNTGGYPQSSPSACVDKNGRIWVAWHGTDSTDNSALNIRVAYSDDGGATWSSMTKLTSGNTYYQYSPSITVNKNNEVFVLWYGRDESDTLNDIRMRKYNGSWGSVTVISTATTNHKDYPSALYDVTIDFSTPLFIYREQNTKVGFYGTWTATTISVPQGSIGQKSDKSNILSYNITTDGTMSDITEKINGVTIATRTNPTSGQNFTVSLSQAQWDAIKYGNAHTLTITMGSDTWTYTFDKRLHANDDVLSAVKGVQDLQTHLNGIKAQLAAAIRAKGGTVNDTDAWSAFVSAVSNMTNKRWASGTVTSSSTTTSFQYAGTTGTAGFYSATVTGLTFKPSLVILFSTTGMSMSIYLEMNDGFYPKTVKAFSYNGTNLNGSVYNLKGDVSPASVTSTGFVLPVGSNNTNYTWLAFE